LATKTRKQIAGDDGKSDAESAPEDYGKAELDRMFGDALGDDVPDMTFQGALMEGTATGTLANPAALLGGNAKVVNDDEKAQLVGVPFIILSYRFNEEGVGGRFVTLDLITARNERIYLNDGSTGIRKQIEKLEEAGMEENIVIRRGLRVSTYRYDPDTKKVVKPKDEGYDRSREAHTYYLDTSR
jgi:hypothetical protein